MDLILFAVSSLVLIREHISHAVIGGLSRDFTPDVSNFAWSVGPLSILTA
jgi:hypothetical protein